MNYIGVFALIALGLVLLTGIGGMVSFGQTAFMGIAAYSTAWVSAIMGYSPWLGLVLAIVLSGAVAAALGAITPETARPFPVYQHGRVGHRDLFHLRQHRGAGPQQRHRVDPADFGGHRRAR